MLSSADNSSQAYNQYNNSYNQYHNNYNNPHNNVSNDFNSLFPSPSSYPLHHSNNSFDAFNSAIHPIPYFSSRFNKNLFKPNEFNDRLFSTLPANNSFNNTLSNNTLSTVPKMNFESNNQNSTVPRMNFETNNQNSTIPTMNFENRNQTNINQSTENLNFNFVPSAQNSILPKINFALGNNQNSTVPKLNFNISNNQNSTIPKMNFDSTNSTNNSVMPKMNFDSISNSTIPKLNLLNSNLNNNSMLPRMIKNNFTPLNSIIPKNNNFDLNSMTDVFSSDQFNNLYHSMYFASDGNNNLKLTPSLENNNVNNSDISLINTDISKISNVFGSVKDIFESEISLNANQYDFANNNLFSGNSYLQNDGSTRLKKKQKPNHSKNLSSEFGIVTESNELKSKIEILNDNFNTNESNLNKSNQNQSNNQELNFNETNFKPVKKSLKIVDKNKRKTKIINEDSGGLKLSMKVKQSILDWKVADDYPVPNSDEFSTSLNNFTKIICNSTIDSNLKNLSFVRSVIYNFDHFYLTSIGINIRKQIKINWHEFANNGKINLPVFSFKRVFEENGEKLQLFGQCIYAGRRNDTDKRIKDPTYFLGPHSPSFWKDPYLTTQEKEDLTAWYILVNRDYCTPTADANYSDIRPNNTDYVPMLLSDNIKRHIPSIILNEQQHIGGGHLLYFGTMTSALHWHYGQKNIVRQGIIPCNGAINVNDICEFLGWRLWSLYAHYPIGLFLNDNTDSAKVQQEHEAKQKFFNLHPLCSLTNEEFLYPSTSEKQDERDSLLNQLYYRICQIRHKYKTIPYINQMEVYPQFDRSMILAQARMNNNN